MKYRNYFLMLSVVLASCSGVGKKAAEGEPNPGEKGLHLTGQRDPNCPDREAIGKKGIDILTGVGLSEKNISATLDGFSVYLLTDVSKRETLLERVDDCVSH